MNKAGFTLVETLIYLAIIGVVVTSFVSFGISIMEARNKNLAVEEVQANARAVLSFMAEKIRSCKDISVPAEGAEGNILSLDMAGSADIINFSEQDGTVYATVDSSQPQFLTSSQVSVSDLNFLRLGQGNVKINFTIKFRDDGSKDFSFSEDVETAATMRVND
jgi:prepilin-type N-terminal cleavage/methylation domain-containing protein